MPTVAPAISQSLRSAHALALVTLALTASATGATVCMDGRAGAEHLVTMHTSGSPPAEPAAEDLPWSDGLVVVPYLSSGWLASTQHLPLEFSHTPGGAAWKRAAGSH